MAADRRKKKTRGKNGWRSKVRGNNAASRHRTHGALIARESFVKVAVHLKGDENIWKLHGGPVRVPHLSRWPRISSLLSMGDLFPATSNRRDETRRESGTEKASRKSLANLRFFVVVDHTHCPGGRNLSSAVYVPLANDSSSRWERQRKRERERKRVYAPRAIEFHPASQGGGSTEGGLFSSWIARDRERIECRWWKEGPQRDRLDTISRPTCHSRTSCFYSTREDYVFV